MTRTMHAAFVEELGKPLLLRECDVPEVQTLASINEIFARLQRGDVASRVVLEFARP